MNEGAGELRMPKALFYGIGNCASTVVEIKKNCEAILVIVAAGRQFFTIRDADTEETWNNCNFKGSVLKYMS